VTSGRGLIAKAADRERFFFPAGKPCVGDGFHFGDQRRVDVGRLNDFASVPVAMQFVLLRSKLQPRLPVRMERRQIDERFFACFHRAPAVRRKLFRVEAA